MNSEERLQNLAGTIAFKGYGSVSALAGHLGVSEMTVRRDLEKLERKGFVRRTHGGAYTKQEMIEVNYWLRETVCREEKEAIGRKASSMIEPAESIFIDAGTTTFFLASAIDDSRKLTIVTNSLVVCQALENRTNVETILLGGRIRSTTHGVVGPLAEQSIKQFRYTRAFLGTAGINLSEGLTHATLEEVPIKRQAAANAQKVIVLADHTKFNKDAFALFMRLNEINTIITDAGVNESDCAVLREKGIEVIIAEMR